MSRRHRPLAMHFRALPVMFSMIPRVITGVDASDIETIKEIARTAYPAVPQLSTSTLADWMEGENAPLLIDVRSPREFAVSHLRGAINLQTPDSIAQAVRTHEPATAVLYCSVGFRSARLTSALQRRGLENVFNLEGSIFQWANEGRPLFCGQHPAAKVHPYGQRWAGMLNPGLATESARDYS